MAARHRAALVSLLAVALSAAGGAAAADPHPIRKGDITVSSRSVRPSFGAVPNSAAYMVIANSGATPDRLIAARCACAASVDIHQTEDMAGMSMMKSAAPVTIPAHGQVIFHPGGLHLMLTHLKGRLAEGGEQDIILVFQRAGTVRAPFQIRAQIPAAPMPPMPGMGR